MAQPGTVIDLGGGSTMVVRAGSEQTNGAFALLEYTCAPGAGAGHHQHANENETFYMLSGALTFQLEEQTWTAGPGDVVHIQRGQRHAFINQATSPAVALIIAAPPGMDDYFVAVGELIAANADPAAFAALNASFGLS